MVCMKIGVPKMAPAPSPSPANVGRPPAGYILAGLTIPALLVLSACATPQAGIRDHIVTVDKPVPVACVAKASVPPEPAHVGIVPPDARQAADLLGAVDLKLRNWGAQLEALLTSCTD